MEKNNTKIILILLSISLFSLLYFYISSLKSDNVFAVSIGTHNPGHLWSEMECSNAICIDVANNRIGIGGKNEPTEALDVNGSIKVSGDVCNSSGSCLGNSLGNLIFDGVCGFAEKSIFTPTELFCSIGYPSSVSGGTNGPWSWTCSGLGGGRTDNCSTSVGGGLLTGQSGCVVTVNGAEKTISFSNGQAAFHWGGFAATNYAFTKTSYVTITFDYIKPDGYDSNLRYALSLRVNANSAGGHASTYYFPTTTYGEIWHNTSNSTSYQSATVEIKGSTGQYRINSGTWTAIPNWSSIASTYNLEFADYGYGNGTSPSYIRNPYFTVVEP